LQSARRSNAPASCHLHPDPIDIAWVEQMRSFQVVAAAMKPCFSAGWTFNKLVDNSRQLSYSQAMRSTGSYVTSGTLGETVRAFVPQALPPRGPELAAESFAALNHAAELRELLGLGESDSAKVEASRYLSKWSQNDDGFLEKHTERGRPYYTLR